MERSRPSADVSQKLKLAVLVLVPVSNLFLLIALVSNNWINANGKDGFEYLGLWRGCNSQGCGLLVGGVYVKVFLILAFIGGVGLGIVAWLQLKYDTANDLHLQKGVAVGLFIVGAFQAYGMIHGSIIFVLSIYYVSLSWSYAMGWIAVITNLAAGCVSYYHYWIDPPIPGPTPSLGTTPQELPPNTIIVS
ncbi:lens fiber membrane intrinsic protein-like [Ascaphus truei]|uniref:lens fiber membrane intrinsic protein-like n=1 Tax=Ascaphus truei TaxID=8439 RepID=UPI003F5AC71D